MLVCGLVLMKKLTEVKCVLIDGEKAIHKQILHSPFCLDIGHTSYIHKRPYIYSQKAIFTNGHKYHIEKWHTRLKKVVEKAHFTFLSVKKKEALRTCNGETCMLALPKIYKDSQFYLSNL